MDNKEIIGIIKETTILLELNGENDYKVRSYQNAIFNLERYTGQLSNLKREELEGINGVGAKIAANIFQLINTGKMDLHDELVTATPPGILELTRIKGVGTKKILSVWKELNVDSPEKLKKAIEEGQLEKVKGFGTKTQENILEAIRYYEKNRGKMLYAEASEESNRILEIFRKKFPGTRIEETGPLRRKMETIDRLGYLVEDNKEEITDFLTNCKEWSLQAERCGPGLIHARTIDKKTPLLFELTESNSFDRDLLLRTGSGRHLHIELGNKCLMDLLQISEYSSEKDYYKALEAPYISPELREGIAEHRLLRDKEFENLITPEDIRGVIHCHSTWSDGLNSIKEMAEYAQSLGYEYLGLTDHSKSAYYYANGLYEERVLQQMEEIDGLNRELAPFRIFKGIESDILVDGSLDYPDEILSKFDFIIASIHGSLSMDIKKATTRLLRAVENPFTTIMGHLTGRLLLVRKGYPVNHRMVIDACAANNVAIEINAHPKRLDLDWRWVNYAMEKGVKLSINPDAHRVEGIHDIKWGIWPGRKGGLTRDMTLNCLSAEELATFFEDKKAVKN